MSANENADRMSALERRVTALEKFVFAERAAFAGSRRSDLRKDLETSCGLCMTKSKAASLLGVTRVTVYHMIERGELNITAYGKVTTESVARALTSPAFPWS